MSVWPRPLPRLRHSQASVLFSVTPERLSEFEAS